MSGGGIPAVRGWCCTPTRAPGTTAPDSNTRSSPCGNNEAEYAAIIAALELARVQGVRGVLIRSDSQLCVNQITGRWQVREPRLRPLRERAAKLLRAVQGRIEWVPRGQNQAGIYLEKKYKR
ncbi:MAG: hypothetical protein C4290_09895 [Chloroflexota bacterium]